MNEVEPPRRQRSLAIAQALAADPRFDGKKRALENVLTYESLVQTVEELSGQKYPEELKAATLIRDSEAPLREHLELTVTEGTSYAHLREAIRNFEKANKSWTTVLKSLNSIAEPSSSSTYSGPQPMEVDRVWVDKGGKRKGKGKSKSKGKSWWNFGSYALRGAGRGVEKIETTRAKEKENRKARAKEKAKMAERKVAEKESK